MCLILQIDGHCKIMPKVGDMETTQHGNASKKQNHKTNLMSSSLNLKLKRLYSKYKEFKCKNRNCSCNLKIL